MRSNKRDVWDEVVECVIIFSFATIVIMFVAWLGGYV